MKKLNILKSLMVTPLITIFGRTKNNLNKKKWKVLDKQRKTILQNRF